MFFNFLSFYPSSTCLFVEFILPPGCLDIFLSLQTMGTNEHSVLVDQFTQVIVDVPMEVAEFFLEANNWQLAVRLWDYFPT